MTQFVDVGNMARWIQREGVEHLMTEMIAYLEDDFRRWESFDKIPRIASHTPFGVIELMPTSDLETYAFKYVNGHPRHRRSGAAQRQHQRHARLRARRARRASSS